MISDFLRLSLLDRATDLVHGPDTPAVERAYRIAPATLFLLAQHLRRTDIDHHDWQSCTTLAESGSLTHHQARIAAAQLVKVGLLERTVLPRRIRRQDSRYTVYRLALGFQGEDE
ncbi:hypothetical protein KUF83_30075 [Streptomyces sp. BV286]|uniref:hypothetical protein n=1 Tax=Streptomyces sp. BV286 TaxID=2849672 RepID=UPI001C2EC415|nr:hypothetical protein [Streptomyces sp. BV286]MBV1940784.1 hypothetical protein [Streptomyces sp. BV286]